MLLDCFSLYWRNSGRQQQGNHAENYKHSEIVASSHFSWLGKGGESRTPHFKCIWDSEKVRFSINATPLRYLTSLVSCISKWCKHHYYVAPSYLRTATGIRRTMAEQNHRWHVFNHRSGSRENPETDMEAKDETVGRPRPQAMEVPCWFWSFGIVVRAHIYCAEGPWLKSGSCTFLFALSLSDTVQCACRKRK